MAQSHCCGSLAAYSPPCATSSPTASIAVQCCSRPSLIWGSGQLKSSPARRAWERSRPSLDAGSSSVRLLGSVAIDGLPKTSRRPLPVRKPGSSLQASACFPTAWQESAMPITYFRSDSQDGSLFQHHFRKRIDIGLQHHEKADEAGQHDGMPEHVAQDRAFMSVPVGRGGG